MSYNTTGRIKVINDTQTFPSGFQKREFVVTVPNGEWPQDLKFELTKDKCEKEKYYVNLLAWRIKATQEGQQQSDPNTRPPNQVGSQGAQQPAQQQSTGQQAPSQGNLADETGDIPF